MREGCVFLWCACGVIVRVRGTAICLSGLSEKSSARTLP